MTLRAIIIGLLGAAAVCGFTYFNDAVILQTLFVGNHMPFTVYGALILFLLLVNPILRRVSNQLPLSSKELAVILALTLPACCIPSSGLMREFASSLVLPHRNIKTETSWQRLNLLDRVPERMLADVSGNEDKVLNGFWQGLGKPDDAIPFTDVPWGAWVRPIAFWIPLLLTIWVTLIALAVIVQKQWSKHEHLPYPIAQFAQALIVSDEHGLNPIFRNKLFWTGLIGVFVIHFINYLGRWFPQSMVEIKLWADLNPVLEMIPNIERGGGGGMFTPWYCRFYFSAFGIAYLLSKDVSFSVGIAPFVYFYVSGLLTGYGVHFGGGGYLDVSPMRLFTFGAFLGFFLIVLYSGRHYYTHVLLRSLRPSRDDEGDESYVWAGRIFMLGTALFIIQICLIGVDWPIAILYTLSVIMIFLVVGRITAETGLFFFQLNCFPCMALVAIFGANALGLGTALTLYILTTLVVTDGREMLTPYLMNAFKTVDAFGVGPKKISRWFAVSLVVGLLVALPVTLYTQYNLGANHTDGWALYGPPRFPYDSAAKLGEKLEVQGKLETAGTITGLARFANMGPDWEVIQVGLLGLGLSLLFSFCRLRFIWWPIHPILFLVNNTYAACQFGWSFLAGWFVKALVTRYGGMKFYQKLRFLMFGLIAGDLLGSFVPFLYGIVYYWFTRKSPPIYWITPP